MTLQASYLMTHQNQIKPPNKIRLIIISVVIGLLGGGLLIGIPGALVLGLLELAYSFFDMSPLGISGHSVWPIAIMISLLWPAPITPLSIYQYRIFPQQSIFARWLFSLLGSIVITVLAAFLLLM